MPDPDRATLSHSGAWKEVVLPVVGIAVSVMAAYFAHSASESAAKTQHQDRSVDQAQQQRETELTYYVHIATLVNDAIARSDQKSFEVSRVLVNQITDDEVKNALLEVLSGASSAGGSQLQSGAKKAAADLAVSKVATAQDLAPNTTAKLPIDLTGWSIQVLYCASNQDKALSVATTVGKAIVTTSGAAVSLKSVGAAAVTEVSSGAYNVNYFDAGDRKANALKLAGLLSANFADLKAIAFVPRAVSTDFGRHLSFYICPA